MKNLHMHNIRNFLFWLTSCSIILLFPACTTQETSKQGSVAQNTDKAAKECRTLETVGSRLRSSSVCMTKEEWAIIDAREKEHEETAERDKEKFFRRTMEKSGFGGAAVLDNPNTP